ncbi:MAG: SRPBCC domain-containing protein [Gemmatimonadota bacterium]
MSTTDRIEKEILLRAPRARVWRALTETREFAAWFGFKMEGEFRPGSTVKAQRPGPEWEHFKVEFKVERMEPETLVESGFDQLLAARHAEAFPKHTNGWVGQIENIRKYVDA